jgi:hypothetical protein
MTRATKATTALQGETRQNRRRCRAVPMLISGKPDMGAGPTVATVAAVPRKAESAAGTARQSR